HAQFLSQGEGLVVMGCGLVDVWGLATYGNVAEETVGMRLIAASDVGARELADASGQRARLVHTADEAEGLAQLGGGGRRIRETRPASNALSHLVEERESLRATPGQDIRRPQDRGNLRQEDLDVGALTER